MPSGGARPGAGKPKGSYGKSRLRAIKIRELLTARIEKEINPLLDALMDSAKGQLAQTTAKNEPRVYEKSPNPKSLAYALDQSIGKAIEKVEITGSEGGPVQSEVKDLSQDKLGEELKKILNTLRN